MAHTQEMSGTVTQWLKPKQPLALWWQQSYPGLRQVARELAARLLATRSAASPGELPAPPASPAIPVDTPGLRYYDYGLLGGAIDYRMRMEFTPQWGGDPNRSAFTRAWGGKNGSLAHSAAALLADCAPVLGRARPDVALLAASLPALSTLLEEYAARVAALAPWDWRGEYGMARREEIWLLDFCFVLADLDNFYRDFGARFDFTPLLSQSGYRGVLYASGRLSGGGDRSAYRPGDMTAKIAGSSRIPAARQEVARRLVGELERSWPVFAYLCRTPGPTLEGLANVACGAGRTGNPSRLQLLRADLAAQLALWHSNPARQGDRPPRVLAANPTFAGSTRLPADGDLIVRSKEGAGMLVDFKSLKRIEPSGLLTVLRQILTYALMDEADEYEISRVGFYFTRYGVWAHWDLADLLDTGMGANGSATRAQPRTLDSHRESLRRLLLDLRQPQAFDVAVRARET